MSQDLSPQALVELVHRYWPANLVSADDPRYVLSEQFERQKVLREAAMKDRGAWSVFLSSLEQELPGCEIWELPYLLHELCRYCRISLPGSGLTHGSGDLRELVCMVSVLAPVEALFGSLQRYVGGRKVLNEVYFPPMPPEFKPLEDTVSRLATSQLGCTRLSNEVLFTPVPDLKVGNLRLGEAKLIDCLFSTNRW